MDPAITLFAQTNFRNQRRKFGIKVDDRRRHMYLVGKTGMGKSTTLENMIINDIRAGKGLSVVDPHGDLAEKILHYIPTSRTNDVIYFNPSDTNFPVAFNILENVSEDYKHLVAYGLVGVFKKIWADSWGPRMEYILTNTILALLDYPGSTLLGVMRVLVDKQYRKKVVAKVQDPVVKTFWADEFNNYSEKFRTEAIAPIQNKVGQFLASSIIRNIVGQSKSTIEMREIMDDKKILIMNLAKGRVGEENSALLGAMMITKLQIAAMSRVDIPEEERSDFYLYVDEFQNFATDSFAGILSEARKYRLCLIMAHQYIEQLGDEVKAAVFGNVGTLIVFRVGAADALELEPEFAPQFTAQDIVNLDKYTFCMRLMIDGIATQPFSAIGLPPVDEDGTDNMDKVIKVSRERYARPRHIVEDRIIRWSGVEVIKPNAPEKTEASESDLEDDKDNDDLLNIDDSVTGITDSAEESQLEDKSSATEVNPVKVVIAPPLHHSGSIAGPQGFIPEPDMILTESVINSSEAFPIETLVTPEPPTHGAINEPPARERPRINFIKTQLPSADDSAMPNNQADESIDNNDVPDSKLGAKSESTETESSNITKDHEPVDKPAEKPIKKDDRPQEIKKTETAHEKSNPDIYKKNTPVEKPVIDQPKQSKAGERTISLNDLKEGGVPEVKFSGHKKSSSADDQPGQSENNHTESIAGGGQNPNDRKRKRKRKRKKSSAGEFQSRVNQSATSGHANGKTEADHGEQARLQQPQSPQSSQKPNNNKPESDSQTVTNNPPALQPKIPSNPKTKVNLGDLM